MYDKVLYCSSRDLSMACIVFSGRLRVPIQEIMFTLFIICRQVRS